MGAFTFKMETGIVEFSAYIKSRLGIEKVKGGSVAYVTT